MLRLPRDGTGTCDPCIFFTYLLSGHTRQVTTELRLVIVTTASEHCFRGGWGWYYGRRIGYYTPLMIIGSAILVVGTGLITMW